MSTSNKLTYLNETKSQIRKAIEEENLVTIDDTTTFREYSDKIKATNEEIKRYIPTDSQKGTSLQVTNAVPLNIKKGVIDGNSYQYTTKGNQLFDFANARAVGGGVTWNFDNDVLSVSSIAGTTGYKSIQIDITDLCKENKGKSLNFTDNGYSVEDISLNPMVQITVKYSDGTSNFYRSLRNYRHNTSDKYTIPEDMTNISSVICGIYSNNTSNAVANNLIIEKPLLYFDDNNEYEPYTGGKASPNPDYPQEIEVVSGKNIIGLGTPIDGYTGITNSGKWINSTSGLTYYFETSKLPDEVIISGDGNRSNVSYFNSIPTTNGQIADKYETTNYQYMPRSFKVDKNYKYIFIQVYYDAYGVGELNLQLEKGSIATEIIPFNTLRLTNSGKNICPTDYEEYWEKGQYSTQGVKEEKASRCRLKELLRIKPNTDYYCSCYLTDNSNYRFAIRELDKNKNFVSNKGLIVNGSTYTSSSNAYYIAVTITYIDSETEQNYEPLFADGTIQPLICLSSCEDKTFEPYRETDEYLIDLKDNFIAKINDVKDTLDLTSGVLSKNVKKVVLDGVNLKVNARVATYNKKYEFTFNFDNSFRTSNSEIPNILCDKLIARSRNETFGSTIIGGIELEGVTAPTPNSDYYGTGCTIYRDKWANYTVEQVNEDLQNDPLTLYYQVAETETIQLEPINIKMYEGTNNIELDTNLETNMNLDYYKDYLLDNQEVEVSGVTE